jgi:peptide-methionine (S)-S-oxide reductase
MLLSRLLPAFLLLACGAACTREGPKKEATVADSKGAPPGDGSVEVAPVGGGCFRGPAALFSRRDGVISGAAGHHGGRTVDPTYEDVCSGTTGHAEVIEVRFDPKRIGYDALLEVFFKTHDPTTLNRQGADVGTQYRSIVLVHDDAQRRVAQEVIRRLDEAKVFDGPIVTQVVPYDRFYAAEGYHQGYFDANPTKGYCRVVIGPKLEKLEKVFRDRLKR